MTHKLTDEEIAEMNEHGIPDRMQGAIIRYVEKGIAPGHFLRAVINNDLAEAVGYADRENQAALAGYVRWFYNNAPSACWGFSGAVDKWRKNVRSAA
jgi:hypothetical protein